MELRARTLGIALAIAATLSLALGLSACASQAPEETTPPAANDPATSPLSEMPRSGDSPSQDMMSGARGTAETIGSWTVTVREFETGSGNDDVAMPPGAERLKIEVDVRNDSGSTMTVRSGDWTLVSGDVVLEVLAADEPEKRGERTIDAGETEDVTLNFALSDSGTWVLRFEPTEGGPGILEVPVP